MTDEEEEITRIDRREAASGRVSFSDPVTLHETSRSRVVMVPFFIPHDSSPDELAIKIVTYRKAKPPEQWFEVEEKSLSLKEAAARRLLKALHGHLAVAKEEDQGSFVLLPIGPGSAQVGDHDPADVASALLAALASEEIVEHLSGASLESELTEALKSAVRLAEMRSAVNRLRELLETGQADEALFQDWCEKHTWAFGNAYVMRDEVREISPGDQLDILLPTVISGHRDIVELKRPDMHVLRLDKAHRNYYFSAEVSKAIGQCHRYLDVLHEEAANGLRDHPEVVAYHPRATIVIGRSGQWPPEMQKALHGMNSRLRGISVMTYDQLLSQGERLLELVAHAGPVDDSLQSLEVPAFDLDDEEIQF